MGNDLLIEKKSGILFQICVAFSECPNFNKVGHTGLCGRFSVLVRNSQIHKFCPEALERKGSEANLS